MTPADLIEYRHRLGLSPKEMSRILQCNYKTYDMWEAGTNDRGVADYVDRFLPLVYLIATDDRYAGLRDMVDFPDVEFDAGAALSPTALAALNVIIANNKLVRTEHGHWSAPGIPCIGGVPRWYFADPTIEDLLSLKRLSVSKRDPEKGNPIEVIAITRRED